MLNKLINLSNNSYSPYSNFRVSSIIVLDDGTEIGGVNVESSSFGATLCAERNAISSAISKGIDVKKIREIHILGYSTIKSKNENNVFTMPCGICRQVMMEQLNKNTKVLIHNYSNGQVKEFENKDLLPFQFTGKEL